MRPTSDRALFAGSSFLLCQHIVVFLETEISWTVILITWNSWTLNTTGWTTHTARLGWIWKTCIVGVLVYTEFKPSVATKRNDGGTFVFYFHHRLSLFAKFRSFFTICVTEFVNHNCPMWLPVQTFFFSPPRLLWNGRWMGCFIW
jgi:hypothetical protein